LLFSENLKAFVKEISLTGASWL